ncbi:hypothetical protein CN947_08810, partial [Bacillus cereus]
MTQFQNDFLKTHQMLTAYNSQQFVGQFIDTFIRGYGLVTAYIVSIEPYQFDSHTSTVNLIVNTPLGQEFIKVNTRDLVGIRPHVDPIQDEFHYQSQYHDPSSIRIPISNNTVFPDPSSIGITQIPESNTDRQGIMGIISDISGVGSAINTVKSVIEGFNTARSVILEIANNTDLTLTKVSEDISHGGWAVTPQGQIPPQKALVFGAQSSGGSLFTGTEGSITYTGDGIQLTAYWDNPWAGNNSCDLKLTGPKAGNYKINKECGAGNTNAHMRYELFPSTTTTPQTKKNKSYSSGSISAVARIPDSMEVWWIGANGSVQDAFWYAGQQWKRFELA